MTRCHTIKLVTIAGLLLLIFAGSGIASAYSISAHADEKQIAIIKELYGTKITQGEYWEKVYPNELAELKKNIPEKQYAEFYNSMRYWGDDHPELPNGANVWDENGPVNLKEISSEEKREFGLENLKTDESGYVVQGMTPEETKTVMDKLCALVTKRSAIPQRSDIVLSPNALGSTASSIFMGEMGLLVERLI